MEFSQVRDFLESWGLTYGTADGESSTIPYPQVYARMKNDAVTQEDGTTLAIFISCITDTTDGETYLTPDNMEEVERVWNTFIQRQKRWDTEKE